MLKTAHPRRVHALAVGVLLVSAGPAAAGEAATSVAWSTYMRAGPGEVYAALDELEHDVKVSVLACDARWCRVSDGGAIGYVDRDALDLPRIQAPQPPSRDPCAVVSQADDRRPRSTRFCSVPPTKG